VTVEDFDTKLTPEQRQAMIRLCQRSGIAWDDFLKDAIAPAGSIHPYVGIENFHGMFVGIEPDGYTHS
jgi:hypothetical protein